MKFLLPFLFIFMLPLLSFTDDSTSDYCPPLAEDASVNTLVKICTFAFINTSGNPNGCQAGALELDVDNNCIGTTEGTVRAINLDPMPVIGQKYPLLSGMPEIYYEYELPNGQNIVEGPIRELTYFGEHVSALNGNDFPVFEYHIPISLDVSQWCANQQIANLSLTIRLAKANGDIYPIENYSESNQAFYCQVFEETCSDCSEQVMGCNGGYPPLYFASMCGDCGACQPHRASSPFEDLQEVDDEEYFEVSVQPNPFDELLDVKISNKKESEVLLDIVDINGKIVYQLNTQKNDGEHKMKINTSNLSSGVYFIRVNVGSEVYTEKLLKLK